MQKTWITYGQTPFSLFVLLNTQNIYCYWILGLKKYGIKQQSLTILTTRHIFLIPVIYSSMYALSYYCTECRKDHCKYCTLLSQGCDVGSHVSCGSLPSSLPSQVANMEFTFTTAYPFPPCLTEGMVLEKSLFYLTSNPAAHYHNHTISLEQKDMGHSKPSGEVLQCAKLCANMFPLQCLVGCGSNTLIMFAQNILVIEHL